MNSPSMSSSATGTAATNGRNTTTNSNNSRREYFGDLYRETLSVHGIRAIAQIVRIFPDIVDYAEIFKQAVVRLQTLRREEVAKRPQLRIALRDIITAVLEQAYCQNELPATVSVIVHAKRIITKDTFNDALLTVLLFAMGTLGDTSSTILQRQDRLASVSHAIEVESFEIIEGAIDLIWTVGQIFYFSGLLDDDSKAIALRAIAQCLYSPKGSCDESLDQWEFMLATLGSLFRFQQTLVDVRNCLKSLCMHSLKYAQHVLQLSSQKLSMLLSGACAKCDAVFLATGVFLDNNTAKQIWGGWELLTWVRDEDNQLYNNCIQFLSQHFFPLGVDLRTFVELVLQGHYGLPCPNSLDFESLTSTLVYLNTDPADEVPPNLVSVSDVDECLRVLQNHRTWLKKYAQCEFFRWFSGTWGANPILPPIIVKYGLLHLLNRGYSTRPCTPLEDIKTVKVICTEFTQAALECANLKVYKWSWSAVKCIPELPRYLIFATALRQAYCLLLSANEYFFAKLDHMGVVRLCFDDLHGLAVSKGHSARTVNTGGSREGIGEVFLQRNEEKFMKSIHRLCVLIMSELRVKHRTLNHRHIAPDPHISHELTAPLYMSDGEILSYISTLWETVRSREVNTDRRKQTNGAPVKDTGNGIRKDANITQSERINNNVSEPDDVTVLAETRVAPQAKRRKTKQPIDHVDIDLTLD